MSLVPWNHFNNLDKFFSDDWFMPSLRREDIEDPAMNLYETDNEVVVELSVPGVKPEDIEISVSNGVLRVSGKSEEETEEKDRGYYRKEIRKGSFERSLRIPENIDADKVNAKSSNGLLKIVMQKLATPKSGKKIEVRPE